MIVPHLYGIRRSTCRQNFPHFAEVLRTENAGREHTENFGHVIEGIREGADTRESSSKTFPMGS